MLFRALVSQVVEGCSMVLSIMLPKVAPNPSVKFVPPFDLHGTRRKRRAPYLKCWAIDLGNSNELG